MASNESKCRDCGETLVWDDKILSASGKKIPHEKNGNKHNCPFSKFNKTQDKALGDKTPMEALSAHEREIKALSKRLDDLEIEVKWGNAKTNTAPKPEKNPEINWENVKTDVEEPKTKSDVDWDKIRAEATSLEKSEPETKSKIDWDKYKT